MGVFRASPPRSPDYRPYGHCVRNEGGISTRRGDFGRIGRLPSSSGLAGLQACNWPGITVLAVYGHCFSSGFVCLSSEAFLRVFGLLFCVTSASLWPTDLCGRKARFWLQRREEERVACSVRADYYVPSHSLGSFFCIFVILWPLLGPFCSRFADDFYVDFVCLFAFWSRATAPLDGSFSCLKVGLQTLVPIGNDNTTILRFCYYVAISQSSLIVFSFYDFHDFQASPRLLAYLSAFGLLFGPRPYVFPRLGRLPPTVAAIVTYNLLHLCILL